MDCPAYKVSLLALIQSILSTIPKWYTAFPQIVSRVGHSNPEVYTHLSKLIVRVLQEYPKQALWLFTSVVKSTKPNREHRGKQILKQLQVTATNLP